MAKRRRRRMRTNPHRRRRAHHRRHRFGINPIRRRFRRNPIEGAAENFVSSSLVPAAVGAAGAVGTDILLGYLPVPWGWRQGSALPIVRILASLGVGWIVTQFSGRRAGESAAAGGIIVTLYQILRPWAECSMPFQMARYVPLRGLGAQPGMPSARLFGMGQQAVMRMRTRVPRRRLRGLGAYVNPARTTRINRGMMRYIATNRGG